MLGAMKRKGKLSAGIVAAVAVRAAIAVTPRAPRAARRRRLRPITGSIRA